MCINLLVAECLYDSVYDKLIECGYTREDMKDIQETALDDVCEMWWKLTFQVKVLTTRSM